MPTPLTSATIIGGSPCSGKSTMAEMLAAEWQMTTYKVDDHEQEHLSRCRPERQPVMCRLAQMNWNEIWSRPPELQVQEELAFYRERFAFILEDLRQFDPGRPLLLEGAAYLPELIHPHHPAQSRVLYMVPAYEFQRHHYRQRPWIKDILAACDDPNQAFANWMQRDHLFGQEILRQAQIYGFSAMIVDGRQSIEEQFTAVKAFFTQ